VKVSSLLVHVLSVSSLKGGVGKTTVTLGLTSAAFARGLRTLVVDLDPQSDVSTGMDIDVTGHLNIADVLASPKEKAVRAAIAPSGWTRGRPGKVDVLIGSPSAINFDGPHPSIRDIWKLEEALAHLESEYDLVLIDSAPSLNALTRTAWAASDRVTIVTEPGLFSVAAADRALRAIEELRRGLSPRLQPLGIIVNRAKIQSLEHQFRIKELREMFGPLVLSPQLPERTSLQQAQGAAKPLHVWPGESAQEMAHHFDQLLDRVIRAGRIPVGGVPFEQTQTSPTPQQAPYVPDAQPQSPQTPTAAPQVPPSAPQVPQALAPQPQNDPFGGLFSS
jgi:cellulose biosynthesis protein BcsQ